MTTFKSLTIIFIPNRAYACAMSIVITYVLGLPLIATYMLMLLMSVFIIYHIFDQVHVRQIVVGPDTFEVTEDCLLQEKEVKRSLQGTAKFRMRASSCSNLTELIELLIVWFGFQ